MVQQLWSTKYIHLLCLWVETSFYIMDSKGQNDERCENRLYIGNLDQRISESAVIKMFSPFGKIVSEDFLWHTRGPKRGEPRGYAFIQYSTKEEAQLAKMKMNGRLACGRPLVIRFANDRCFAETGASKAASDPKKLSNGSSSSSQMSRSAMIAAIRNKLKSLEEEGSGTKRPKLSEKATEQPDGCSSSGRRHEPYG